MKLRRTGVAGDRQTLTVPDHSEIEKGTLRAILRQSTKYIPDEELRPYFYQ